MKLKLTKKQKARIARRCKNDGLSRIALGNAVRREAERRNLSRDDMAAICKDAASQMSRVMTGHDDEFSADRLVKMLARLGVRVRLYLEDDNAGQKQPRPVVVDLNAKPTRVVKGAR